MARRGENIYKRKDGRYEGRYPKGRKPDGQIQYGYVYGYKYKEVKEKLTEMKAVYSRMDCQKGHFHGSFREWAQHWIEQVKRPYIKESTYTSYRNKLEKHVLPVLGERPLNKLSVRDLQLLTVQMQREGLSAASVQVVFRVVSSILQKAADKHLLYMNPCKEVMLPKVNKVRKRALNLQEQKILEQEALKEAGCSPVILGSHTGMRISEISGLKWEDIDLKNRRLYITSTIQRIPDYSETVLKQKKTKIIETLPKSGTSERVIPLSPMLCAYLEKCKAGSDSAYVVSCNGSYAEPRVIQYRFKQMVGKIGLSGISFHTLRHTFATRCLEEGVDIATISALLGHASAKMTLDIYADSVYEKRIEAIGRMDLLFQKKAAGM